VQLHVAGHCRWLGDDRLPAELPGDPRPPGGLVIRALAAVLAVIAIALTAGPARAASVAGLPRVLRSLHWSGYAAVACGTCRFRSVTATWRVPAVSCADSPLPVAQAAAWAGLDGLTDGTVQQAGTTSACTDGTPSYFAWYQMYPGGKPVIAYNAARTAYGIRPGDTVTVSVTYDAATRRWHLALTDSGTGTAISASQPCPDGPACDNQDAEVVMEPPVAGATVPLADFGIVTFTRIAVTSRDGTRGTMVTGRLWSVHRLDLHGAGGTLLAAAGLFREGATGFTDTWLAAA
jgi:peptidase A4-like protein